MLFPVGEIPFGEEGEQEQVGLAEGEVVQQGDEEEDRQGKDEIRRGGQETGDAQQGEQEEGDADGVKNDPGDVHRKDQQGSKDQGGKGGEGGVGDKDVMIAAGDDPVVELFHIIGFRMVAVDQGLAAIVIAGKIGRGCGP